MSCHTTVAQGVRARHTIHVSCACVFDLSSTLSSNSSFVSHIIYFILLNFDFHLFLFHVDVAGARSPVHFAQWGVWPFGQQRPSHKLWAQLLRRHTLATRCNRKKRDEVGGTTKPFPESRRGRVTSRRRTNVHNCCQTELHEARIRKSLPCMVCTGDRVTPLAEWVCQLLQSVARSVRRATGLYLDARQIQKQLGCVCTCAAVATAVWWDLQRCQSCSRGCVSDSLFALDERQKRKQRSVDRAGGFAQAGLDCVVEKAAFHGLCCCRIACSYALRNDDWQCPPAWGAMTSREIFDVSDDRVKRSYDTTSARPARSSTRRCCFQRSLVRITNASNGNGSMYLALSRSQSFGLLYLLLAMLLFCLLLAVWTYSTSQNLLTVHLTGRAHTHIFSLNVSLSVCVSVCACLARLQVVRWHSALTKTKF